MKAINKTTSQVYTDIVYRDDLNIVEFKINGICKIWLGIKDFNKHVYFSNLKNKIS